VAFLSLAGALSRTSHAKSAPEQRIATTLEARTLQ
jgi:hypothetical protein